MSALLKRMIDKVSFEVKRLGKLRGDGIIKVSNTEAGPTLTLDIDQLLARLPKTRGASSNVVTAYAVNNASGALTIQARLRNAVDGELVTVQCASAGGSQVGLNECFPLIEAGDPMAVYFFGGQWRSSDLFQPIEECS